MADQDHFRSEYGYRKGAGRSDRECPKKKKLVEEILQATAELEETRPEFDVDSVYTKRRKKKK